MVWSPSYDDFLKICHVQKRFLAYNSNFCFRNWLHLRWLPIPNRLCPVVLKGQHMVLAFSFFGARFFFVSGPIFLSGPTFSSLFWTFRALKLFPLDPAWKILSNALLFISNGGQEPELWLVLCSLNNNVLSFCVWVREALCFEKERFVILCLCSRRDFFWKVVIFWFSSN